MDKMLPVKKSTWLVTTDSYMDFSDMKRFGEYVVGGVIVNIGSTVARLDDLIDLPQGTTIPLHVDFPYCDKSNYKISFAPTLVGNPDHRVLIILYKRI